MNRCSAVIPHVDRKGRRIVTKCGGWLAFLGISVHRLYGWRRWAVCTSPYCGVYVATDQWGGIAIIQKNEPPEGMFKSRGLASFREEAA